MPPLGPAATPRDPQQPWHLPRGNRSDFSPKGGEKKRKKVEEASEASPRFVSLPVGAPRVIPMVPQSPAARVQGALSFPSFSQRRETSPDCFAAFLPLSGSVYLGVCFFALCFHDGIKASAPWRPRHLLCHRCCEGRRPGARVASGAPHFL